MCITFTVKHICGHEHIRHKIKCLQTIKCQLDLAEDHITDSISASGRWECLCEADLPREYIKPGICEQCKRTGLVSNFFEENPAIESEVLRQWQAHKRILKAEMSHTEHDGDWNATATFASQAHRSTSSIESNRPETPASIQGLSSDPVVIRRPDGRATRSETLSPVSYRLNSSMDPAEENVEKIETTVVPEKPRLPVECNEGSVKAGELSFQMKMLKDRVRRLLPEERPRSSSVSNTRSEMGGSATSG